MTPATPPPMAAPVAPPLPIDIAALAIGSPKRNAREEGGWHGFFPYYAGYPHSFADRLIESAALPAGVTILDPWNGSGTTTYSAAEHGFLAEGWDVNPVMVIIARARLLPLSEADMLGPLARDTVSRVRADQRRLLDGDPLLSWFERPVAALIRGVEIRIREQLVGATTFGDDGAHVERMSAIAATFYVALFSVCRDLVTRFQASNPTWLRKPKAGETLVSCDRETLLGGFIAATDLMASSLETRNQAIGPMRPIRTNLGVVDTALAKPAANSIDLILSSPPYCTRIDYSAATRIELAILYPRLRLSMEALGRTMIGSTRVPKAELGPREAWGDTCLDFLVQIKKHPSKASDGYYYKTHLDYFDKMARSLEALAPALRPGAAAVLVVQDSFYKEIHNDLPTIIGEMGVAARRARRGTRGRRDPHRHRRRRHHLARADRRRSRAGRPARRRRRARGRHRRPSYDPGPEDRRMTVIALPSGILRRECVAELKRSWRLPQFLLPTVVTPAAFYALFTLAIARSPTPEAVAASLAGYGVFAATGPALFGFGAGVAMEREQGLIELKRVSPMPASAYLGAKLVTAMAATAVAVLLIYALGAIGGARLSAAQWASIFALHLLSTIPFALIGFGIGMRMGGKGAVAIANAVFLGSSVLGGLWIPSQVLPGWMRALGEFVPSFHLGQLGLEIVGAPALGSSAPHAAAIMLMTGLAGWWAWAGWRRSPA